MIQDISPIVATLLEVKDLINNLLILLSPKEKHIIENRYCLNEKMHVTLEKIGREFGVTRERIRQIEKNALKKLSRNVVNTKLHNFNQFGKTVIQKYEGVVLEEKLASEILNLVSDTKGIDIAAVKLSLELDASLEKVPNTINYYPFFKLKTIERKEINNICEQTIHHLQDKKEIDSTDNVLAALEAKLGKKFSKQFVLSCLELDRRLKLVKKGVGLATWRHINPRTLRDKILYILNEIQKPLHYVELANKIAEMRFDKKVINVQAVHNELIRDNSFVLIGRGIYALRKWGYDDGTVAEVISNILREKGALDREQIINEVLKKRQVKRITILLNLKNKPIFERVGRDTYSLKAV
ncbi:MAG: sigma factor-like helix-turn-helix DNA-binding protein [Patescibacteria group bacterium]